jgi:Cu(I)/Ag(I) efflux system membrane fusion protein
VKEEKDVPTPIRVATLGAAALLLAWLLACGDDGRSRASVLRSGGVEVAAWLDPAAPRVGENRLWIELRGPDGEPIEDADVAARVHMHAMGAMPPMGGPAGVRRVAAGRYRADFQLAMGGTWLVEIDATLHGARRVSGQGSLRVGVEGLRLEAAGAAAAQPAAPAEGAAPSEAAHEHASHPGEVAVAPERLQQIGVRTTRAERGVLAREIRALGLVTWDETAKSDVSLKVRGWIGEIAVGAVGEPVEQGQVLFHVYGPELLAAQEEYLLALRSQQQARGTSAPDRSDALVRSARQRLRLWDVAEADIDALARRGEPLREIPIRSPRSGFVVEKSVVAGSGVEPGRRLYRIAPLSPVWIEAEVYEEEALLVRPGDPATVELPFTPGVREPARVALVNPALTRGARTARVRLELANAEQRLRPDMYVNVRIEVEREEALLVPDSAVLHAGDRSFVFLALGGGRFRPQQVQVGRQANGRAEILAGLSPGDEVVAAGTFLIASEARLRAALEQW